MNTIVRASAITSSTSRFAASASTEPRAPVASSISGGFHIAIERFVPGEPSREITCTSSSPVSREASSPGLATVAEASRKRGAVPCSSQIRRSRRSTLATCEPKIPR